MKYTINVTQEDIKLGVPTDECKCPIALACRRAIGMPVRVDAYAITVSGVTCCLPNEVDSFIQAFDTVGRRAVEPFSFEIELPEGITP